MSDNQPNVAEQRSQRKTHGSVDTTNQWTKTWKIKSMKLIEENMSMSVWSKGSKITYWQSFKAQPIRQRLTNWMKNFCAVNLPGPKLKTDVRGKNTLRMSIMHKRLISWVYLELLKLTRKENSWRIGTKDLLRRKP